MARNFIDAGPVNQPLSNAADQLTGIVSVAPVAKYLSGARCILRINGKIKGFAFGISWKITNDVTEIRTIDDPLPYELAPSIIRVEGTISGFRIPGQSPNAENYQADIMSFLHQRYVQIEVRDSQSDNLIFLTKNALITGRSENIRSNALAEMSLSFVAIGYQDEKVPSLPENADKPNLVTSDSRTTLGRAVDKIKNAFK